MSYSGTVLGDSPSAYWRLGEASGTSAADASGNSKTGTYENTPTLGVTGLLTSDSDTAVTLNGTTQDVLVPTDVATIASGTGAVSIEAWIKTSNASGTIYGARSSTTANPIIRLYIDGSGNLAIQCRDNGNGGAINVSSDCKVHDGVRHHVVATRDTSKVWRLYVDGVQVLQSTDTMTNAVSGLDWSYIGRERRAAQFFNGTVDEVATYNAVTLTETQIRDHYTAGSAEATTGTSDLYSTTILADSPNLYWRLGEASGIRAVDDSGNVQHGARRNGAPAGSTGLIPDSSDPAVLFDGTDDRIDIPSWSPLATSTTAISADFWIKTSSNTKTIIGCRRWGDNTSFFLIGINVNGKVIVQVRQDGSAAGVTTITGSAAVNDGNPHYVAVTRDTSKNWRIYIDGVLDSGPTGDGLGAGITAVNKSAIGVDRTSVANFWNGTIDDLAFYPTTLTATQVANHYAGGRQVTVPFISSVTAVYTPTFNIPLGFISSVTQVYALALQGTVDVPFITSNTVVYTPTLTGAEVDVPFIASSTTVYALSVQGDISLPFIASSTTVYALTLLHVEVDVPFISSVTTLYALIVQGDDVEPDFIDSVTVVYGLTLQRTFAASAVSQVTLEVAMSNTDAEALASQVCLEVLMPIPTGLHVWQRS